MKKEEKETKEAIKNFLNWLKEEPHFNITDPIEILEDYQYYLKNKVKETTKKTIRLKNKQHGARVIIDKVLLTINPKDSWKYLKKVPGTIVPKLPEYEQYWHTSDGTSKTSTKHIIKDDCHTTYAVKLDDEVVDIEGNNVLIIREYNLKFVNYLEEVKVISKNDYKQAKKTIEEYERQQTLK